MEFMKQLRRILIKILENSVLRQNLKQTPNTFGTFEKSSEFFYFPFKIW